MRERVLTTHTKAADIPTSAEEYGRPGRATGVLGALSFLAVLLALGTAGIGMWLFRPERASDVLDAPLYYTLGTLGTITFLLMFIGAAGQCWMAVWKDWADYRAYVISLRNAKLRGLAALNGVEQVAEIKEWSCDGRHLGANILLLINDYLDQQDRGRLRGIQQVADEGVWLGRTKALSGQFHGVRTARALLNRAGLYDGREEGQLGRLALADPADLGEAILELVEQFPRLKDAEIR